MSGSLDDRVREAEKLAEQYDGEFETGYVKNRPDIEARVILYKRKPVFTTDPSLASFIVAVVNLFPALVRDRERLQRIEEAAREYRAATKAREDDPRLYDKEVLAREDLAQSNLDAALAVSSGGEETGE